MSIPTSLALKYGSSADDIYLQGVGEVVGASSADDIHLQGVGEVVGDLPYHQFFYVFIAAERQRA